MKDYFCMWLQYYILFFRGSSGQKPTFSKRFLIYTFSCTLYLNSHYLCKKKLKKRHKTETRKSNRKDAIVGAILIFLFLYELYRWEKQTLVPFHQCQLFVVCVDFEQERRNPVFLKKKEIGTFVSFAGFLGKTVRERPVRAPFVYSTRKTTNKNVDTRWKLQYFSTIYSSENKVHEMIVLSSSHRNSHLTVLCVLWIFFFFYRTV